MTKAEIKLGMTAYTMVNGELQEVRITGRNEVNHKATGMWDVEVKGSPGRFITRRSDKLFKTRPT